MEKDKYLETINNHLEDIREQFEIIKEYEGKIPAIELDLVLSNLRKVYEAFLQLEKLNQPVISFNVQEKAEKKEEKKEARKKENAEEPVKEEPVNETEAAPEPEKEQVMEELPVQEEKEETVVASSEKMTEPEPQPEPVSEPVTHEKTSEDKPVEPLPAKEPVAVAEAVAEKPGDPVVQSEETEKKAKTTLDLFGESSSTLADSLKGDKEKRVADKLQVEKIEDIKSAIGINEKFLFINELFDGSLKSYEEAINRINQCPSETVANTVMAEFREKYSWDMENSTTRSFLELVNRKF